MLGSHLSVAGGLHNALFEAQKLGMDCVQVFTKNQRQWKAPPLTDEQVRTWKQAQQETGITEVVSHDSYLINLASPKEDVRAKSIDLFREELLRCEALGIPNLVTHPGAHLGEGEDVGLAKVAEALDQLHGELKGLKTVTCLEITAGQGTSLGYKLEHLASIRDQVKAPERLAVCLDTAHLLAAGYDLTSEKGAKAVLDEVDAVCGKGMVNVVHMNDSKVPLGSRKDRHEHIGHGHVALEAFGVIVRAKRYARVPKVLETAKAEHESGEPWDAINLKTLRDLA